MAVNSNLNSDFIEKAALTDTEISNENDSGVFSETIYSQFPVYLIRQGINANKTSRYVYVCMNAYDSFFKLNELIYFFQNFRNLCRVYSENNFCKRDSPQTTRTFLKSRTRHISK